MLYKEILPGHDKVPVISLGDPAYPLLPHCMKEFLNAHNNEEAIFNNMWGVQGTPLNVLLADWKPGGKS